MKLVTVATKSGGYFPTLQDSCKRFNCQLDILGWNQKWQGFTWRLVLMQDYLANLPDSEIVCFIDGYDVIMLRSLIELENTFKLFISIIGNNKIIIGCDKISNFIQQDVSQHHFGKCQNKSINAGTYIGYVKNLKLMINSMLQMTGNDDQIILTKYCNLDPDLFYIDCDSIFFCTILNPYKSFLNSTMEIIDNQLYVNGIQPFFAHGNGNTNINDLITQLGYQIYYDPTEFTYLNFRKRLVGNIQYLNIIIPCILIIIIIIILIIVYLNTNK
jgi:hypothetical protein